MAKAAQRVSASTTLVVGQVEIAIGLFASVDKPGGPRKFDSAGPSGGVLKAVAAARPVPVDEIEVDHTEPVIGDPLGEMFEASPTHMLGGAQSPAPTLGTTTPVAVEGEYGRELIEEGTGQVVAPDQVRKGVRLDDGRFIDCTEHLAQIEADTKIERAVVVGFVPITAVARARVKATQYVGAGDEQAPVALRLFYEAMKRRRRVMVVKITKRSRQTLAIIGWHANALMLYELVWAEDFRPAPPRALAMHTHRVTDSQVEQACDLIDAMAVGVSALDELRDDAIAKREEIYDRAVAGQDLPQLAAPAAEPDAVAGLEALLAASLERASA